MIRKLSIKSINTDYSYIVAGISSQNSDYHLSWKINNALNIELKQSSDYNIKKTKTKDIIGFSKFSYISSEKSYSLISNKSENHFLVSKTKNLDYFFIIVSKLPLDINFVTKELKKISGILGTFSLKKNKNFDKIVESLPLNKNSNGNSK